MTYRINGVKVSREEFMSNTRGIDFSRPPAVLGDYNGYACPVTGSWIEGRAAHKENLKRTSCRLLEKGEKEHFVKTQKREQERATNDVVDFLTARIAEKIPEKGIRL